MSAFELFVAIGGFLLVGFFLFQALQRDRQPDGYKHRGGIISMARPKADEKSQLPLRPAAAKILAERERDDAARLKARLPKLDDDDPKSSAS